MTEIGKNLKNARIEKGYTLDDLQQITKIQKRYLIAIEDERFEALPGDFYVKAFIRQYAETVGLNSEELLASIGEGETKQESSSEKIETREDTRNRIEATRQSMAKTNSFNRFLSYLPTIIIVLIVVAILGSIYFVAWNKHQKTADSQQIQSSSTKVSVSSDGASTKQTEKKKVSTKNSSSSSSSSEKKKSSSKTGKKAQLSLASNSGSSFIYNLKNSSKTNTVKVSVKDSSAWTAVSADGTQQWQGTLSSGANHEVKIPESSSSITINLGNSKATKISINGRNFNFLKDNSSLTVRTLTINIK
ncbi:transcriptional regulator [Liquorilactobacillus aquaticus DSM 21051]|uniref:Transcriptional regulator n=1 Tax=Liquorilactobacillus aquaticus DSM 21051 TaxID=1423725 RepID=A0A0R2CW66_9LACO|nr:helix-turn-helix domain-containing protein [Liquorilactobacillus aquaticus]KRM95808.1 transcriptional regulator [Liquorilactobacillus aquaticus DSM 21051]